MDIDLETLKLQTAGLIDPPYPPEHSTRVPYERLSVLIEVAEAALEYAHLAPFPVYIDLPSEHAGRRLEAALKPFGYMIGAQS